ncbi:MAG: glycosyltransferase [Candidatus Eremiobacteraeota bacterium]|nr:glycosyltransferase [Candidatus Eremiobacteraeota bacterium]MBC5804086.1 glycosyltransferase [Candidatus Eremiobacteraeota bacterium]MBC5821990.1 glycosyltransferase [Candidatus Eremiobacteraeota bacterium]
MRLSVIIATKDRAPFLAHALASLEAQREAPDFEVVVVDNGSSDATPALLDERKAAERYPLRVVRVVQPNRAAARNAGIAASSGVVTVFVDDDVWLPGGFLAAHHAAHREPFLAAVSGPIVNVPSYDARPTPRYANYSRAFFCTCNVSVPRSALVAVGAFDETFNLYGWEDTELGLRLRRHDVRRAFAWDAYLWHVKPPHSETLDVVHAKAVERARMAARLLRKDRSLRTRLATGAYGPNLLRSSVLAPTWSLRAYRAVAMNERVPNALRALARAQFLDGAYTSTLRRALRTTA